MRVRWRQGSLGLLLMLMIGCASYSETILQVENNIGFGNYELALKQLQKEPGPPRDRVLFLLNQGMLLQMLGRYQDSNASFETAKKLMQQLEAVSVREQTGSVTVNDGMRSYAGDPYDQVLVHVYGAINYLMLGDLDGARVEVKQMDLTLRHLKEKKGSYREDGFGRYLAGIVYEQMGDYSNALVSYRLAYKAYETQFDNYHVTVPEQLKDDLLRLSDHLGLSGENREYQRDFGRTRWTSMARYKQQAHVIAVFHNGMAPVKLESWIQVQDYETGKVHRIALPYYQTRPNPFTGISLSVGEQSARSEVVENVDAIAHLTLKEQMPAIQARALARAVAKNRMVDEGKDRSDMAGLLVNLATVASERADTRSWITLPQNIHIVRLDFNPGEYDIRVDVLGQGNSVLRNQSYPRMSLVAGQTGFIIYHAISPASTGGAR